MVGLGSGWGGTIAGHWLDAFRGGDAREVLEGPNGNTAPGLFS